MFRFPRNSLISYLLEVADEYRLNLRIYRITGTPADLEKTRNADKLVQTALVENEKARAEVPVLSPSGLAFFQKKS